MVIPANASSSIGTSSVGWATPEHFQTVLKQIIGLVVILGVLNVDVGNELAAKLAQFVSAGFIFAASAWSVVTFLKGQTFLKGLHLNFFQRVSQPPTVP